MGGDRWLYGHRTPVRYSSKPVLLCRILCRSCLLEVDRPGWAIYHGNRRRRRPQWVRQPRKHDGGPGASVGKGGRLAGDGADVVSLFPSTGQA